MAAVQLLLLLTCVVALSSGASTAGAAPAKLDAELEAEAEEASAAEVKRALSMVMVALAAEPWSRQLEAAREVLGQLLAAMEAHTATVLLHKQRRLEQLQPAIEERLEAARALLVQTHQELMKGAVEGGAAALAEVTAALARVRDSLASLGPPPAPDAPGAPPAGP